jgi:hypothetical protein
MKKKKKMRKKLEKKKLALPHKPHFLFFSFLLKQEDFLYIRTCKFPKQKNKINKTYVTIPAAAAQTGRTGVLTSISYPPFYSKSRNHKVPVRGRTGRQTCVMVPLFTTIHMLYRHLDI